MINIKKNSLEMLRGKVVEDAIRQSFFGTKPHDIKFAQRYAHDDFIIKSQNYPKSLVNKSLKPINNLVSSGIKALLGIGLKNIKEQKERYYVDSKLLGIFKLDNQKWQLKNQRKSQNHQLKNQ